MAGDTGGAGHAYPSGAPDLFFFFCGNSYCYCFSFVSLTLSSVFMCNLFYLVGYVVVDHLCFTCLRLGQWFIHIVNVLIFSVANFHGFCQVNTFAGINFHVSKKW